MGLKKHRKEAFGEDWEECPKCKGRKKKGVPLCICDFSSSLDKTIREESKKLSRLAKKVIASLTE